MRQQPEDKMENRTLREIAREIRSDWKKVYFGAVPYIEAMVTMDCTKANIKSSNYMFESAQSIVLYFLANANTWRSDVARRVKQELKEMCK
jgi:hypothetical protein